MSKQLVNKAEFSRLANVSRAAVTKACSGKLKAAWDGKYIDANHVDARAYLKVRNEIDNPPVPTATGIDPFYDEALALCQSSGKYSKSFIQRELKLGYNRASKIIETMIVLGLVPKTGVSEKPETGKATASGTSVEPVMDGRSTSKHVRGSKAAREKMKAGPPVNGLPVAKVIEALEVPDEFDPLAGIPDDIRQLANWTLLDLVRRFGSDVRFGDWLKAIKSLEDIHEKRLKNSEREGELVQRAVVKVGVIDTINTAHRRMLTDGAKSIAVRAHALGQAGTTTQELEDMIADQLGSYIRPCKGKMARVMRNL